MLDSTEFPLRDLNEFEKRKPGIRYLLEERMVAVATAISLQLKMLNPF